MRIFCYSVYADVGDAETGGRGGAPPLFPRRKMSAAQMMHNVDADSGHVVVAKSAPLPLPAIHTRHQ